MKILWRPWWLYPSSNSRETVLFVPMGLLDLFQHRYFNITEMHIVRKFFLNFYFIHANRNNSTIRIHKILYTYTSIVHNVHKIPKDALLMKKQKHSKSTCMSDYNFPKTEKWHETLNNIIIHHNMYIYMYILIDETNKK